MQSQTLADMGLYLLKSMDFHKKQILSIEDITPTSAKVIYKDNKILTCHFVEKLPQASELVDSVVYCLNKKDNVDMLISQWQKYAELPHLIVTFLDLKTGNKWSIRPHMHNQIADVKKLSLGIGALFAQSMAQ